VNKKLINTLVFVSVSTVLPIQTWGYPVETGEQTTYIHQAQIIHQILANMVLIKGGTYMMGTSNKKYFDITGDNAHPHKVTLSSFYFPRYLVDGTQYLSYLRIIGQSQRAKAVNLQRSVFNKRPAQDNWKYASGFCEWLGKQTGLPFSLPTEAQWEYVARDGGKDIAYPTPNGKLEVGKNYPDRKQRFVMWYGEAGPMALPVDDSPVNQLGIHQMGGNVSEWTQDWYVHDYYWRSPVNNPQGPKTYPGTLKQNITRYGAPRKVARGFFGTVIGLGCKEGDLACEQKGIIRAASAYGRIDMPINSKDPGFRCVINSDKSMSALKAMAQAQ
jgi:sulfatase modifying factor 1